MNFLNEKIQKAETLIEENKVVYNVTYANDKFIGVQGVIYNEAGERIGNVSSGVSYNNLLISIDKNANDIQEEKLISILTAIAKDIIGLFKQE